MKLSLLYGAAVGVTTALSILVFGFTGCYDTFEAMQSTKVFELAISSTVGVLGIALSVRASREKTTADDTWGFGKALSCGTLTGFFASILLLVFMYSYVEFINPDFTETLYQGQVTKMVEQGFSSDKIASAEPTLRMFISPFLLATFKSVNSFLLFFVLSLGTATFLRSPSDTAQTENIESK